MNIVSAKPRRRRTEHPTVRAKRLGALCRRLGLSTAPARELSALEVLFLRSDPMVQGYVLLGTLSERYTMLRRMAVVHAWVAVRLGNRKAARKALVHARHFRRAAAMARSEGR